MLDRRQSFEDDEELHSGAVKDDAEKRLLPPSSDEAASQLSPRLRSFPASKRRRGSDTLAGLLNWLRHRIRLVVPIVAILLVASGCGAFFALKDRYNEQEPIPPLEPLRGFHPQSQWDQRTRHTELHNLCSTNQWRPGLWTNCTMRMGLNNLRSELAQCMKFAVDAGAGLVLPRIQLRNNDTLAAWHSDAPDVVWGTPDIYFDIARLKEEVSRSCPGFRFRDTYDHTNIKHYAHDAPRQWWELRFGVGDYRKHFDELLHNNSITSWSDSEGAVIIETLLPYSVWNYRTESAAVANTFFDMIHWAPNLNALGEAIAFHPDLAEPYAGVHLRVERDVISFWATFDNQSDAYEPWIRKLNVKTIYLACGDAHFERLFQERFSDFKVVGKWELLSTLPDRFINATANLTFDQLAVLDYVPMLHAKQVYGIGVSSFAYLLGVDRRDKFASHYADSLHMEIMPEGSVMVGDNNTLLLPPILPEYYDWFP